MALATDAQLVWALDPAFEGLSPRAVLELLVAGDFNATWRLRQRTMDPEQLEDLWRQTACNTAPGEWRIALVAGFILRILIGDEAPTAVMLSNLAWMLGLASDELGRYEERLERLRRAA